MKVAPALFAAVLLASSISTGSATTLVVRATGIGSGSLAGTSFDSAPFEVSATYNTEDVRHYTTQFPENTSRVNVSDLRFAISGVGQGAIEVPSDLFANRLFSAIGLSRRNEPPDLVFIQNASLKTYDLLTPIGPTSNLTASATHFFFDVPTSSGELDFSTMRDVVFQVAVPEPTSSAILATGFFVVVWHWRRRPLSGISC